MAIKQVFIKLKGSENEFIIPESVALLAQKQDPSVLEITASVPTQEEVDQFTELLKQDIRDGVFKKVPLGEEALKKFLGIKS
jgi:hypothetical protein